MSGSRDGVCEAAALPPGERLLVAVEGTPVCVFNVDGAFYAVEHECAHRGGPICKGDLGAADSDAAPTGDAGSSDADGRPTVACPWHGWTYDLATGEHLGAADAALETFAVDVEDGTVFLRDAGDRGST